MSNFKWKDLLKLNSQADAYLSPLSCISHIDMNAFFAQVEQVRCGYSRDDPVVCVQWNSIIAVSYAARKYGISRMDSVTSAMEKCPNLIPIHPAVFKRGEDFWQYHDGYGSWNKDKNKQLSVELYKVSLIPYRREGRKILKIFQEYCDLVEKASVDEVFMDMGRLVFQKLLLQQNCDNGENSDDKEIDYSIFQDIRDIFVTGRYNLDSTLPMVPDKINEKIKFKGNIFTSSQSQQPAIEDWDDVIFALASHITDHIRSHTEKSLGYTTSCGIARTKTVAKLGSNYKKPDAQTVILNKYMNDFLDCGSFEITSFWTMGGFLGQSLVSLLSLPTKGSIKYIRESWITAQQLKEHFNAEMRQTNFIPERNKSNFENIDVLSKKLYELVNGEFREPLNPKPVVKSMMSNKNMRGKACNSLVDIISWLEVFCSELTFRVEELEQEYKKVIKPNTVTIYMKTAIGEMYRKSGPIIYRSSTFNGQAVLKASSTLAKEFESFYSKKKGVQVYPLVNLNITISNFDILDYQKNVMDMFGNQAQVLKVSEEDNKGKSTLGLEDKSVEETVNIESFYCKKCDLNFDSNKNFQEHLDFDVAMKLSETLNGVSEDSSNLSIGERRLLFRDTPKQPTSSQSNSRRIGKSKSNKSSHPKRNILNFFKK
ncbi:DNA-directed DNA polymerase eta rad30 [Monosporozyma unispora]|mgnify:CR=1 FL=1|nr:DNA-directed DNA polymerase eta rad30 [Kazachstania unispora]